MRRDRLFLGVLTAGVAALGIGLLVLGVLFYQATPKSVIASQSFVARLSPVLGVVRILDRALNPLYRGPTPAELLPHYELTLNRAELQAIEDALPRDDVYLSEDAKGWAGGTLSFDGKNFDVKARVRGDRYNHWLFRKKSWRLSFPDEALFHGVKETNLIIPEDRVWFVEMLSAFRADALGLFHPPMRFVTASINGSGPMLYLEIEHWTKEMLEKQARPGDVNLYKTGGIATSSFNPGWDPIEADPAYWGKYQAAVAPPLDSFEEVELLFSLSREDAHLDPNFQKKVDLLFDREKLVRWYALSLLAGNLHISGDNLRFFWDVTRGRFEPIVWDISSTAPRSLLSLPGNAFWNEVFAVPSFRLEAHRFLWQYVSDPKNVERDLREADRLRTLIERAAYRDPVKLQSNRQVRADMDKAMSQVRANLTFLQEDLARSEILVDQYLPTEEERARGMLLTLDLTSRGSVASMLTGLPQGLPSDVRLYHDTGDGFFDAEDVLVNSSRAEDGSLRVDDEADALLWPGVPATDANNVPLAAPHTRHRFFLVGSGDLPRSTLPLPLTLKNAVTGRPSQVLGNVLLDMASVPTVP